MKSNIYKKMTFEDKFARKYTCWKKNSPKAWHFWKRRNRKLLRIKTKEATICLLFIYKLPYFKKLSIELSNSYGSRL